MMERNCRARITCWKSLSMIQIFLGMFPAWKITESLLPALIIKSNFSCLESYKIPKEWIRLALGSLQGKQLDSCHLETYLSGSTLRDRRSDLPSNTKTLSHMFLLDVVQKARRQCSPGGSHCRKGRQSRAEER